MIVVKDFKTVVQVFKAGEKAVVDDIENLEHWIARGFLQHDPAEPTPTPVLTETPPAQVT
jgi:hypothetical protein